MEEGKYITNRDLKSALEAKATGVTPLECNVKLSFAACLVKVSSMVRVMAPYIHIPWAITNIRRQKKSFKKEGRKFFSTDFTLS